MRSIGWRTHECAAVIAKLALLGAVAAGAPAYAESGRLYAGEANGAGMPVTRDGGADPGALPGDAALAAQSGGLDPQRIYGGLRLNDAVAVEAAQKLPFGDASKPADQALSLAGKARLPLNDGLSVLGKVGVQYSGSILSSGGVGRGDPTPVYGLGLAYEAARGLELRVESEHVTARAGEPRTVTGDSVVVGARLNF